MTTRPAAVAGTFYPAEANEIRRMLTGFFEQEPPHKQMIFPKAMIVPHAGYIYSGPVAASAYAQIAPNRYRRIVLLGPSHRVPLRGLALPECEYFETPLGRIPLDLDAMQLIVDLPQVQLSEAAHAAEHSLEVQLPFLQYLLPTFSLLPLTVGAASPREVAEVLETLWGKSDTLILISSDLSHYHSYRQANDTDRKTVEKILAGDHEIDPEEACGAHSINGLLQQAKRHNLKAKLLDLRNSGDTAGPRDQVVGYASIAFIEDE